MSPTALEQGLQSRLQRLYRVDGPPNVAPYCVETADPAEGERPREALLVEEAPPEDEPVGLALHLAASVRAGALSFLAHLRLGRDASHALDPFCAAFEGVSHFVYLTFHVGLGRPISRIELELQAEIDKYLFLRFALGVAGPEVRARLYDRFQLCGRLPPADRERYIVANREARRYTRWVDQQCRAGRARSALDDARRVYRLPLTEKLERIARAA